MFDYYEPSPQTCPVCRTPLVEWQGKQGPNLLLVWRQGHAAPVGLRLDGYEFPMEPLGGHFLDERLPESFDLYSYDCRRHPRILARGEVEGGVWLRTILLPLADR